MVVVVVGESHVSDSGSVLSTKAFTGTLAVCNIVR